MDCSSIFHRGMSRTVASEVAYSSAFSLIWAITRWEKLKYIKEMVTTETTVTVKVSETVRSLEIERPLSLLMDCELAGAVFSGSLTVIMIYLVSYQTLLNVIVNQLLINSLCLYVFQTFIKVI